MARPLSELVDSRIASGKTDLPVFDETANQLQELLREEELDVAAIQEIAARDPIVASAVLALSNSTFYGGLEKVTTVREATIRLGAAEVARLATIVTQKGNFKVRSKKLRPLIALLWRHSVACAVGSQWLAERLGHRRLATEAFMAGMIHDVGTLLVLRTVDDLIASRPGFEPGAAAIAEAIDALHCVRGEQLLQQCGVPAPYPHVVGMHHDPAGLDEGDGVLLAIVRVVDLQANRIGLGLGLSHDREEVAGSAAASHLGVDEAMLDDLTVQLRETAELADS